MLNYIKMDMKKGFSILRLVFLLAAATVLIFSFSVIERLKILKGKEAKADVPGGSTSGDGSTSSGSTTGNSSGSGSGSGTDS